MTCAKALCTDFGSSSATDSNQRWRALGNSFGVALELAVMKRAKTQFAAGRALAAGAVFLPVLAFGCVVDGHRAFACEGFLVPPSLGATPALPPAFANYSGSIVSRVFHLNFRRIKDLGHSRMKPDPFSRRLHDVRL
jgi:hypothetical protein